MLDIHYYADSRGCQEVLEWVEHVEKYEPDVFNRFYILQNMLRLNGKDIRAGKIKKDAVKKLKGTKDIWQLRVKDDRVLFFYYEGEAIVFTNQFRKKQNSTPQNEIDRAQNRKEIFEDKLNPTQNSKK